MLERRNTARDTTDARCGECGEPLTIMEAMTPDGLCLPCRDAENPTQAEAYHGKTKALWRDGRRVVRRVRRQAINYHRSGPDDEDGNEKASQ